MTTNRLNQAPRGRTHGGDHGTSAPDGHGHSTEGFQSGISHPLLLLPPTTRRVRTELVTIVRDSLWEGHPNRPAIPRHLTDESTTFGKRLMTNSTR